MHINHRRKNPRRPVCKHYKHPRMKTWRKFIETKRRAQAKDLMEKSKYDIVPLSYRRSVLWHVW